MGKKITLKEYNDKINKELKSCWLITFETDFDTRKRRETKIYWFKTEKPTPSDIEFFFKPNDVILFMQQLEFEDFPWEDTKCEEILVKYGLT